MAERLGQAQLSLPFLVPSVTTLHFHPTQVNANPHSFSTTIWRPACYFESVSSPLRQHNPTRPSQVSVSCPLTHISPSSLCPAVCSLSLRVFLILSYECFCFNGFIFSLAYIQTCFWRKKTTTRDPDKEMGCKRHYFYGEHPGTEIRSFEDGQFPKCRGQRLVSLVYRSFLFIKSTF